MGRAQQTPEVSISLLTSGRAGILRMPAKPDGLSFRVSVAGCAELPTAPSSPVGHIRACYFRVCLPTLSISQRRRGGRRLCWLTGRQSGLGGQEALGEVFAYMAALFAL